MDPKQTHLNYINSKGKFKFECSKEYFTAQEYHSIKKYGFWFMALLSGELSPFTKKQEEFIKISKEEKKSKLDPGYEWFKYLVRAPFELNNGHNLNYIFDDDPFFNRKDWRNFEQK
jgi:uncharacterized protein YifE (UPF0438 family)